MPSAFGKPHSNSESVLNRCTPCFGITGLTLQRSMDSGVSLLRRLIRASEKGTNERSPNSTVAHPARRGREASSITAHGSLLGAQRASSAGTHLPPLAVSPRCSPAITGSLVVTATRTPELERGVTCTLPRPRIHPPVRADSRCCTAARLENRWQHCALLAAPESPARRPHTIRRTPQPPQSRQMFRMRCPPV